MLDDHAPESPEGGRRGGDGVDPHRTDGQAREIQDPGPAGDGAPGPRDADVQLAAQRLMMRMAGAARRRGRAHARRHINRRR